MALDRRGFIKGLFAAMGAAAVLDADELLWTPGAKLISVPSLVSPRVSRDGLTDGEKYLCAAMGISELGFMLRRAEMHRKNNLHPGHFRIDQGRRGGLSMTFAGASIGDGLEFAKDLARQ
jgi:hypothetical protein